MYSAVQAMEVIEMKSSFASLLNLQLHLLPKQTMRVWNVKLRIVYMYLYCLYRTVMDFVMFIMISFHESCMFCIKLAKSQHYQPFCVVIFLKFWLSYLIILFLKLCMSGRECKKIVYWPRPRKKNPSERMFDCLGFASAINIMRSHRDILYFRGLMP